MTKHSKKRALMVIGTRPEAIKVAPLVRAMQASDHIEPIVLATGQHTDMMFPILDWFDVSRDFTLEVMRHKQPLSHLAGSLLAGVYDIIEETHPDVIFVQGDTTSAFVGALAGYYGYDHFWKNNLRNTPIEIAHIEAGLRTGNDYSPYPEEMNRKLIGHMAHWNFAPTQESADNLHAEGINDNVFITGNTVIDALFETRDLLKKKPLNPTPHIPADEKIVLITSHRRENYGEGLNNICRAIKKLAEQYADQNIHFVYPVHLNRHVKEPVNEMLGGIDNVHLIAPLQYPEFVALMARSYLVLTDSGGVQEEAPSFAKPVLVMRDNTERPEAVTAGTAKLIGSEAERVISETQNLLDNQSAYDAMAHAINPYGDGKASQRIVNLLNGEAAKDNMFKV